MPLTRHRREGFALAIAIAAIIVIGALIAGVFFASTQQYRIGRNTLLQTRALDAAEYGVNTLFDTSRTIDAWDAGWNTTTSRGLLATLAFAPGSNVVDTVQVTKLDDQQFFITSEGRVNLGANAQARRRVGMLVALMVPKVEVRGALTSRGSVKLGGSSQTIGFDLPVDADCPPPDSSMPGIAVPDTTQIDYAGCHGCVTGDPPVAEDSVAGDDDTYFQFGDVDWTELVSMANKLASGSLEPTPSANADSTCKTRDVNNWGGDPEDPTYPSSACNDYYPIIYAPGDLQLQNGVGQGILLVEGDLKVTGQFSFYGPVIVRGTFSTSGNGNHFTGGLMAANVDLEESSDLGDAVVQYSSCALDRAANGAATAFPARQRPWVALY
ncbi:MAG TPA: hypothetical protein VFW98_08975 [Gemmatimonadaceae bacterium]|nr:hypothetical protein [Gemmatimonadaceae bacterium]